MYMQPKTACVFRLRHMLSGTLYELVINNYHDREIKYEGFGGRPSVGGRPGSWVLSVP